MSTTAKERTPAEETAQAGTKKAQAQRQMKKPPAKKGTARRTAEKKPERKAREPGKTTQAKRPEVLFTPEEVKPKPMKAVSSYRKLLKFGKIFDVQNDEDFKAAAMTYAEEVQLIAQMRTQLAEDGMTVSKEYVKGRKNVCVHPLVQEIPKHIDCANRTLSILVNIIVSRGKKKQDAEDALDEFRL